MLSLLPGTSLNSFRPSIVVYVYVYVCARASTRQIASVVLNLKSDNYLAVPSVMYLKPGTVYSQQNVECGLVASCRRGGGGVQLKQTGGHLHFCCRGLLSSNHEPYSQEKSQKICSEIYD